MDTDTRFDVVISVAIRWDLQAAIFIAHSVVFSHNSLFFHTQNCQRRRKSLPMGRSKRRPVWGCALERVALK